MIERLPPLLVGSRRGQFGVLVGTGVGQAVLAGLTAVVMPWLLTASSSAQRATAALILTVGALALGMLRVAERVVAEQLSQDYVQEVRTGLVASSLAEEGPALGVTVARTTNDLNSVRNWIALGITPLAVGIPVVLGALGALALLDPVLAVAAALPMLLLGVALSVLSRMAFAKSRLLRRRRGRMAAHVGDTVQASDSIRSAGGVARELRRVERIGARLRAAAVDRAQVSGYIRGSAVAAASLAMVAVAAAGSWYGVRGAHIATAVTIVGVLAGPVADLGRVVEYRQSYRAAALIVGPALAAGRAADEAERRRRNGVALTAVERVGPGTVRVGELVVGGVTVPGFTAEPGDRVVLRSADPRRVRAVVRILGGLDPGGDGDESPPIRVAGVDLYGAPADRRRLLVGLARGGQMIERGSIARAVRYRDPNSEQPVDAILEAVGLAETVDRLPDRERSRLRRGGEPLSRSERARLLLGRAVRGEPPLVVLDHIDADLGPSGHVVLRRCAERQPGVVVVASEDPDSFLDGYRVWDLDRSGPADRA